jgi:alpha-galactosidase
LNALFSRLVHAMHAPLVVIPMRRPAVRLVLALLGAAVFGSLSVRAATVASSSDASIAHDESAGTWTLTAGGTSLRLALDASRDFSIVSLTTASAVAWTGSPSPDTVVRVGGQTLPFGSRSAGFTYQRVTVETHDDRLQLNATFDLASAGLRLTRHYAIAAGAPAFEVWTTYAPGAGGANAKPLEDLNALQITVAAGPLRWINGLQGSAADVRNDAAFMLQQKTLANGETLTLGAEGRSSEQTVPWFAIDGDQDEFFATLMWSGAWSLGVTRGRTGLEVSFGLVSMSTAAGAPFDGPHAVFGVVRGGLPAATAALRSYAVNGIRAGRPLVPLVTYNTWFAYGTSIDESSIRAAMDRAAALGVELFVLDAGWYRGAGAGGPTDFDSGLGSWTPDPARFPNGLRPLADYAHERRMKFGIWMEPERVNLSLVGSPGGPGSIDDSWLATRGGGYGAGRVAQICLAGSAGRAWVLDQITALIDEVRPDYLKWDNNGWINCDRDGHDHGEADGNFAHVNALYQMLETLHERYPDLMIENVSGGGNRLDFGMLRYTDVGWMDDRTAPAVHVRHNIEGLSVAFPPAYLFSFVTSSDVESLHESKDMSMYMRSRMLAALGTCFRAEELTEADAANLTREVEIYKTMRETISSAAATLLTGQAAEDGGPPWDVLQETSSDGTKILISAFQSDLGVDRIIVKPAGLDPDATYSVQSVDAGDLGEASGTDLMMDGIDVRQSPNTGAHILIITLKQ